MLFRSSRFVNSIKTISFFVAFMLCLLFAHFASIVAVNTPTLTVTFGCSNPHNVAVSNTLLQPIWHHLVPILLAVHAVLLPPSVEGRSILQEVRWGVNPFFLGQRGASPS